MRGDTGAWRPPGFATEGDPPHTPRHQCPAPEPDLPTQTGGPRSPFREMVSPHPTATPKEARRTLLRVTCAYHTQPFHLNSV